MDFLTSFTILVALCTAVCNAAGETSVYFSLMVSSAPTLDTTGAVRAVNKTLELVNRDSNILPGFQLQYSTVLDTQCNGTRAVQLFNEQVSSNESIVAVIGCGCSSATVAVASASNGAIPVVSFDSTSVTLSDRSSFPHVFRIVPSDESLAPALTTLMQYYGWRKVAIVTEREQQFLDLLPLLNNSLLDSDISIVHRISDSTLIETQQNVFEIDARIIYLNTNPKVAIRYLCKAVQAGRRYPEYVWITPGWYQQGWWRDDEDYLRSLNCSIDSIQQQLNRSLALLAHPDIESQNVTEAFNTSTYATDALMSLAIALNETLSTSPHLNLSLQDAIQSTMFNGASGEVQLDIQGDRQNPIIFLKQFRLDSSGTTLSSHIIARITVEGNFTFINGETNASLWPDSDVTGIPPVINVLNTLKIPVYAYVLFLVAVGVTLSLVCLLFNIIFRNRKVVKLTSPNLNYVIIFGAILLMVGTVFVPSPSRNLPMLAIFCTISRIFLSVGYDICFVVALVKTIRVAYIFWNVSPVKKKVQDWQLLLLATGIIMIEVIYTIPLLSLIYVNGDTSIVIDEDRRPFTNDQGYTVVNRMIICGNSSIHYILYVALSVVFKLIIHVTGLILAFLTRKVKIDPLNDSRYSAILIYISAVCLIVAIVIFFLVEENNTYAGVWTTFVLLEVCVFLGFNFIPKMVSLYRDPEGKSIFSGDADTQSKTQFTTSMTVDNATIKENKPTAVAAESRA